MTYFVFSDSHGYSKHMLAVLKQQLPDELFFLGDGELDLLPVKKQWPELAIHQVQGNCDPNSTARLTQIIQSGRKKVFACHGHTFAAKNGLEDLIDAAFASEADVLLYGHTHIPYTDYRLAMDIMNPGSIGDVPDPTYGVLEINGLSVKTKIIHLNHIK